MLHVSCSKFIQLSNSENFFCKSVNNWQSYHLQCNAFLHISHISVIARLFIKGQNTSLVWCCSDWSIHNVRSPAPIKLVYSVRDLDLCSAGILTNAADTTTSRQQHNEDQPHTLFGILSAWRHLRVVCHVQHNYPQVEPIQTCSWLHNE